MFLKTGVCLLLVACISVSSLPIDKERLRFKVSAKGLPDKDDIGTIDPYVELYATQDGSNAEVKVGRTDTITDNENPDWSNVLEFDFDRSKNQKWHFKIFDHDNLREDDKGGEVWVDVADYVDKGYFLNANLVKQGYLTIKGADGQRGAPSGTPGSLPIAPGTPDSMVLKFKLSANDLPDKDDLGVTDPYVEIYSTDGLTGKETKVGTTGTLTNTKNPSWGETFEFNWNRNKDQRWHFKIFDHDNARTDDGVGKAWVEVNDYVAKGQVISVNLVKKGRLTISRADGLPPNPYKPSLEGTQVIPPPTAPNKAPPKFSKGPAHVVLPTPPGTAPFKGPAPAVLPPVAPPHPEPGHSQHLHGGQTGPSTITNDQPIRLRFKLSGSNFPDKDILGTSDPYARVYISQDGLSETLLKKGTKLSDNENPDWPDIYEFNYDKNKHPKLRILVLDEDDNKRDEEIGNVSLDASEIAERNTVLLKLPQGSVLLTRV